MTPPLRPSVNSSTVKPPPPVCFSYAAYSKTIIRYLRSLNVDVSPGLTDEEISAVESSQNFSFPPDLRSILQAGLPVGTHFPDWRTGSARHLRILLNLPLLHLSKNVARNGFWVGSWGPKPRNDAKALSVVKKLTEHAPVLVPLYGNFYVPSTMPNLAGNPVIQIDGNGVRVLSFDVSGFFQRFDRLSRKGLGFAPSIFYLRKNSAISSRILPAWAATMTRRVEFWSDVAERGRGTTTHGPTYRWWGGLSDECLRVCLDDALWTLRDGGWSGDEVRDMMNGQDIISDRAHHGIRHVIRRRISDAAQTLTRAGWSREDVVYAFGSESHGCDSDGDHNRSVCDSGNDGDRDFCTEIRQGFMQDEEEHQKRGEITTLMYLLSLES